MGHVWMELSTWWVVTVYPEGEFCIAMVDLGTLFVLMIGGRLGRRQGQSVRVLVIIPLFIVCILINDNLVTIMVY